MRWARAWLALAAFCVAAAHAQTFPQRTVTLVVPYSAGGLPDTVARVVGQKLSEKWGQPVVVENKPGGNGVVAAQFLASRPADGYTLMVTDGTMFSVNPHLYKSLPYDAQKDFTFITLVARAPLFLAVHPTLPVANFTEFVALVKSRPGQFNYGSSGIGSIHHLTMESIKASLGLDMVHVPFKGTGQSIPALVSNQINAVFSAMPSLAGFVKEGKVRLIAVNSAHRSGLAPDVATVDESAIPGFDFAPTIGISASTGIAASTVQKVSADVTELLRDPALAERLTVLGIEPVGGPPQVYIDQVRADHARFERAVKAAGTKGE
jgi:tripartite-type tricarboxylate transporter receptor subunit TctC